MSEKSIESRRAFFKKAGKIVVGAAVAAPFLVAAMETKTEKDHKQLAQLCACGGGCISSCAGGCSGKCTSMASRVGL